MRTRPDVIETIQLPSGRVTVDEAGYLVEPADWSREFAEMVAREEGIVLEALHWQVIAFMRDFLEEHGVSADARFVMRFLGETLNLGRDAAKDKLFELFPYGYVRQACKMAGMRQPRAWSTG